MLALFEQLTNELGLVRMKITKDFAPYSPDPKYGFSVAGFPPDKALRIYELQAGVPVDEELQEIEVTEAKLPPPPAPQSDVVIPPNWEEMHRLQLIPLAKRIAGHTSPMSEEEARHVVRAELERRSNSP